MDIININNKNLSKIKDLKTTNWIRYTGSIITLRDQALKKIKENLVNDNFNLNLKNNLVLYAGPTSSSKITIGPTTSKRMDLYLETLLSLGVIATIGKGARNPYVDKIIKYYKAPYFVLYSGVSAYLSKYFSNEKVLLYKELGPEAIRSYNVKSLPLFTSIDSNGNSYWKTI